MIHQPLEHHEWERQLREEALAVCDLWEPSGPGHDWSLDKHVKELRRLAWKVDHRTTFDENA